MKKLLFFLITSVAISAASAYPITPRPLRKLIIESEVIVWAKVIKTGNSKSSNKDNDFWENDYALLVVNELLQGKLKTDTIKVYFSPGMICPAPGVFYNDETVLAFLNKEKKRDGYYVHALSYGVKHDLDKNEYQTYKTRIMEMQHILTMSDTDEKDEMILDWLVNCAEQKCTRWEGVYELSPHSDFMSYYDRGETIRKDIYLNSSHLCRLFDALMKVDTLDYADLSLADITKGINDLKLLSFLKSRLPLADDEYLWTADDIMRRIVKLTANKNLETLLENFSKVSFDYSDKSKKERKEIFSEFIRKMKDTDLKGSVAAADRSST